MTPQKFVDVATLPRILAQQRSRGKRIILCHGTFDLMHAGHIRHFQEAKQYGDVLVVTVTSNIHVNKGPERPVFDEKIRASSVAALACVDFVAVNDAPTAINVIESIRPDVYVKGGEYENASDDVTGNITREANAVRACGGEIRFTHDITFSSSRLLNEYFGIFPDHTKQFLKSFREEVRGNDFTRRLTDPRPLSACVLGDAIIDEYCYCIPLGQSGKGNALSVRYEDNELFAGGAMAVANHIAGFVRDVTLVTGLGRKQSHESFIRGHLRCNVNPVFFYREDSPTVLKRRYVDQDMTKLFEVYFYNDCPLPNELERDVLGWIAASLSQYDLVVVPDYGNGFLTAKLAAAISSHSRFLAVNTQVNSGNRGHHVITRYPRADFIALNEPELRLAAHDRHGPLDLIASRIGKQLNARSIVVTRGTRGALLVDLEKNQQFPIPALSTRVVDRVGAGDALLALASVFLADGQTPHVAAFVGSCAAALEVQSVCNREPVDRIQLAKYVSTLLKWE